MTAQPARNGKRNQRFLMTCSFSWMVCLAAMANIGLSTRSLALAKVSGFGKKVEIVGVNKDHFKTYNGTKKVFLSPPKALKRDFVAILKNRRSQRSYSQEGITQSDLACLLHAAAGITSSSGGRTAPSAGALYPVEIYVAINRSDDLKAGIYHLNVRDFALELLAHGGFGRDLQSDALGQDMPKNAAVNLIFTSVAHRTTQKYGARGHNYILLEMGHMAQNVLLAVSALNLAAVPVGALNRNALNNRLNLDPEVETVHYMLSIGHPP